MHVPSASGRSEQGEIGAFDLAADPEAKRCYGWSHPMWAFTRRITRCPLGYSKKLENLKHAVALFVWHFNFCRVHSAHGKTPAQVVGLTEKALTISELLESTPAEAAGDRLDALKSH